jgi:uncharacterized ferritin-like protein (DUF455 family)
MVSVQSVIMANGYTNLMQTTPLPPVQDLSTPEARQLALRALLCTDVQSKCQLVSKLDDHIHVDAQVVLPEPEPLPLSAGRPEAPALVSPAKLKHRSVSTAHGRAVLLHALAHIEFNAINLALDIVWRYPDMPVSFYRDWLKVAREEAYHFSLLQKRLQSLGHTYGDFPAHNGLWEMATKTASDLLGWMRHRPFATNSHKPVMMKAPRHWTSSCATRSDMWLSVTTGIGSSVSNAT